MRSEVKAPSVSVVVTAYNHARFIDTALQSVIDQTYPDHEIIVVDDGSTDDTPRRVAQFGDRVRLIRQPNQGVASSRNTGIREARGRLLAFLDGDDVWEPEKLAVQVAAAAAHSQSGLIAVDGVEFDGRTVLRPSLYPASDVAELLRGRSSLTRDCYEVLLKVNLLVTTSQVVIPRAVLDEVGLSDARFALASDWDLYLRIAAAYPITFLARRLVRYRYLETSASGPKQDRPLRLAPDEIAVLRKHLRSAPPSYRPLIRTLVHEKILRTSNWAYYNSEADRAWARGYLWSLFRHNPTSTVLACFLGALYSPQPLTQFVGKWLRRVVRLAPAIPPVPRGGRPARDEDRVTSGEAASAGGRRASS
jgi:glycosyltransferase involved in cell wall biosynthesis